MLSCCDVSMLAGIRCFTLGPFAGTQEYLDLLADRATYSRAVPPYLAGSAFLAATIARLGAVPDIPELRDRWRGMPIVEVELIGEADRFGALKYKHLRLVGQAGDIYDQGDQRAQHVAVACEALPL